MEINPRKAVTRAMFALVAFGSLAAIGTGSAAAVPVVESAPAFSPAPVVSPSLVPDSVSLEQAHYNGVGQLKDTCEDHYEYYGTTPAYRKSNAKVYGGIWLYTSASELKKSKDRKFCFQGLATTLVDYDGMKFDIELVNSKGKVLKKDTVRMDETLSPAVFDDSSVVTANKGDFLRLTTHNPGSDAVAVQPLG